jgi:hypothetical protein
MKEHGATMIIEMGQIIIELGQIVIILYIDKPIVYKLR